MPTPRIVFLVCALCAVACSGEGDGGHGPPTPQPLSLILGVKETFLSPRDIQRVAVTAYPTPGDSITDAYFLFGGARSSSAPPSAPAARRCTASSGGSTSGAMDWRSDSTGEDRRRAQDADPCLRRLITARRWQGAACGLPWTGTAGRRRVGSPRTPQPRRRSAVAPWPRRLDPRCATDTPI